MDTPAGFESWSEECKRAFEELRAEWEARQAAELASEAANAAADAAERTAAAAQAAADGAQAEHDAIDRWLDGYRDARRAKRGEIDERKARRKRELRELGRELRERYGNGDITEAEARRLYDEAEAAHDAEVDDLEEEYDELARERARKRARKKELEPELARLRDEAEAANELAEAARRRAEEALDELDATRTEDQIVAAYFALIVRCGPKDPEPGESIAVPPEEQEGEGEHEEEPTPWQNAVRRWLLDLTPWFGYIIPGPLRIFVGIGDDAQLAVSFPYPAQRPGPVDRPQGSEHQEPVPTPPERPPILPVGDGPNWLEGCIEFVWVQGTHPKADPRINSNPVTKTIQWVMRNVREIWGKCGCVRFEAYLTPVTLEQLGEIATPRSGIHVVDGRTRSVSKDEMDPSYGTKIKELQEHEECTGFLVVDGVDGGAGFGGGGVGVVTINRVGLQQDWGDATAHELGHALAGIPHVVNEGQPNQRKHQHGELMWGKGCDGYPERERRRYDKVNQRDCEAMKRALRDTGEPCEEPEPM